MTDYSKLSDSEINQAVAKIFHPDSIVIESKSRPPSACITGHLPSLWIDYCNSWADAGPIIEQSGIGLMPFKNTDSEAWDLEQGLLGHKAVTDKNPLRAAMVVFLMMKERE